MASSEKIRIRAIHVKSDRSSLRPAQVHKPSSWHCASHARVITGIIEVIHLIHLSIKMTTLHQSGAPFVGERVFQSQEVCGQAFPPFPSPTPLLPTFCSHPIFRAAWMQKPPLCGQNFVHFVQEHLLRRLQNLVAGTKIWSLRLVPRIQTGLNFWDKSLRLVPQNALCEPFVGQVPATSPFV